MIQIPNLRARPHSPLLHALLATHALCALTILGCRAAVPSEPVPTQSVATAAAGEVDPAAATPDTTTPVEVRIWVVPELETEDGSGIRAPLERWASRRPERRLDISQRPGRGETGIVPFLRTQSRVVPAELPDVAAVPLSAVRSLGSQGVLTELPDGLIEGRATDTRSVAADAVRSEDGQTVWAVPLALDVPVLVTRPQIEAPDPGGEATATPDGAGGWLRGLSDRVLAWPAPGTKADLPALLMLYASAGGDPIPERLDPQILATALEVLQEGSQAGRIMVADDPLAAVMDGRADAAIASAATVLGRDIGQLGVSAASGPDGSPPPLTTGWALALPNTRRPEAVRQGAAALIDDLTAPAGQAWLIDTGWLPAGVNRWHEPWERRTPAPGPGALETITSQLDEARLPASLTTRDERLRQALREVLDGTSATEAAARVIEDD